MFFLSACLSSVRNTDNVLRFLVHIFIVRRWELVQMSSFKYSAMSCAGDDRWVSCEHSSVVTQQGLNPAECKICFYVLETATHSVFILLSLLLVYHEWKCRVHAPKYFPEVEITVIICTSYFKLYIYIFSSENHLWFVLSSSRASTHFCHWL